MLLVRWPYRLRHALLALAFALALATPSVPSVASVASVDRAVPSSVADHERSNLHGSSTWST